MAMRDMDRRRFLKLAGAAGLGATLPLASPAIGLASLRGGLQVAQETRMMMGTLVAVTVVDPSRDRAQQALAAAFEQMGSLVPLFDRHGAAGPVARLNREGVLPEAPSRLTRVLEQAARLNQISGGAFDVTVAPVIDAFKAGFADGAKPSRQAIDHALSAVGGLTREGRAWRLTKEGASITLDGLAKGHIADQGLAAIAAAGCTRALINAGGDVVAMGSRADGRPWQVAVADPHQPTRAKVKVGLRDGALATSGNYEVYFDQEKLFHHIVDPATGMSPRTDLSVSVRAANATLADGLSTACFVMKPHQALSFLERTGAQGLIFTRQGQRYVSRGFKA